MARYLQTKSVNGTERLDFVLEICSVILIVLSLSIIFDHLSRVTSANRIPHKPISTIAVFNRSGAFAIINRISSGVSKRSGRSCPRLRVAIFSMSFAGFSVIYFLVTAKFRNISTLFLLLLKVTGDCFRSSRFE